MSIVVGIGGARRNASAALAIDGRVIAACEEERVTRARGVGSVNGGLPSEAVKAVLAIGHTASADVSSYVAGERELALPADVPGKVIDHHRTHAATAFLTSPFDDATVLVCDRHQAPELSLWSADATGLRRLDIDWHGPAFSTLYSKATEALGFRAQCDEHKLEALARIGQPQADDPCRRLVGFRHDHLEVSLDFQSDIQDWHRSNGHAPEPHSAGIACGIQRRLGELLLDLLRDIRKATRSRNLCLAGGLFYNSYFNSVLQAAGIYDVTFVPVDPGNSGLAVGAALASPVGDRTAEDRTDMSPFLGAQSSGSEIKNTLDNCKLSYAWCDENQLLDQTVEALARSHLVGWFQGRMEWGPRALGNRSILASPLSPYVAENLNVFLKHRERYRSYGVSVCEEDAPAYFGGRVLSPFMERDYDALDPTCFKGLTPAPHAPIRVQTVGNSPPLFRKLLKAFGEKTGVPILVNTSFNGFREPIVCTPRDAVRVFFGTGLDMAALGNFVLRK